jgi:hypothetical protein
MPRKIIKIKAETSGFSGDAVPVEHSPFANIVPTFAVDKYTEND